MSIVFNQSILKYSPMSSEELSWMSSNILVSKKLLKTIITIAYSLSFNYHIDDVPRHEAPALPSINDIPSSSHFNSGALHSRDSNDRLHNNESNLSGYHHQTDESALSVNYFDSKKYHNNPSIGSFHEKHEKHEKK